jgi:hypothetical protein
MPKSGNSSPFMFSILSGIFLIISGTRGSIGVYGQLILKITSFFDYFPFFYLLKAVVFILFLFAYFGGLTVILGGYLIRKSQVVLGKFVIGVGAGMGIPSLFFTLLTLIFTKDFSAIMAQHGIIGWTGIFLSFIARAKAK